VRIVGETKTASPALHRFVYTFGTCRLRRQPKLVPSELLASAITEGRAREVRPLAGGWQR
jgi:hypothetical protein